MARNVAATNAGVGQASITTKIKLTIQAAKKCFAFGAVPLFTLPLAAWFYYVTPQGFDIAKIHAISFFADDDKATRWLVRDDAGVRRVISIVDGRGVIYQYFTPAQVRLILAPVSAPIYALKSTFLVSVALGGVGYFLLWRWFTVRGLAQQTNKRIRGAFELVSGKMLDLMVRKRGASDYSLVDVALPAQAPMKGVLVIGSQGSGKSVAIHDFMQQVFSKKRKCVIYDENGEFYRSSFRPGIDFFFNPALVGSVSWSIFRELRYTYDANTLAQAFLPPKAAAGAGANSFFEDAARALFGVILSRLAARGAMNTKDIATAFLDMPEDEMSALIRQSVASSSIAGDSKGQRQGVISSISIYLDGISSVNEGDWSISDFMKADDDARLYIVGTKDTAAMFAPLYRLILQTAFSAIAAEQKIVHEDKYWFFLDEVHTLGDIKVDEQLATLRKFGVCVLAGTQNDSQFVTALGKERAETAMNGFNSLLQLVMNEPKSMERAAERLSKAEMETISQNQAVAVVEQRDGAGIVINEQEKWLVMPATIGQLRPCEGFVKLSGGFPTAQVDYSGWLPRARGQKSRVDAFQEKQPNPPRDPRFLITRQTLASGDTPFDAVRRQVEQEKAEQLAMETEKRNTEDKEKTQGPSHSRLGPDGTSIAVEIEMTSKNSSDTHKDRNLTRANDFDIGI